MSMTKTGMRIAMWAAVALVTVAVAVAAVTAATGGRDDRVLTASDVNNQLAVDGSAPATLTPSDTTDPSAVPTVESTMRVGEGRTYQSDVQGGLVTVACADNLAQLKLWSPKSGYRADHVVRGPATVASVQFESDTYDDVTITVTCAAGTPTIHQNAEADDHGGGGGGGDDNSGRDHPEDN
jgi:hypothetical protein